MFSCTGNQLEQTKMQQDKPLYHKSKMAAKMAVPNNNMVISLLISNLKQQNLSPWSLFSKQQNGHYFVYIQHRTMVFNSMNMFSYAGNQVEWISIYNIPFDLESKMAVTITAPYSKVAFSKKINIITCSILKSRMATIIKQLPETSPLCVSSLI